MFMDYFAYNLAIGLDGLSYRVLCVWCNKIHYV